MNHHSSPYASTGASFPDVRGHIISILNDNRNTNTSVQQSNLFSFDLPQFVEPSIHVHPPPSFRNWFGSNSSDVIQTQQKRQEPIHQYQQPPMHSQHISHQHHYDNQAPTSNVQHIPPQHSYIRPPVMQQEMNHQHVQHAQNMSPNSTTVLGKRKSEDESKKRDLVFKGFTMEPESKRIKFVNSDRKVDGINDGPWTDQEHEDFLTGLKECGSGKWRDISEKFVKTRTRVQVASHAQKYFSKLKRREKKAAEQAAKK